MVRGALVVMLLSLGGCYVSATGGPAYGSAGRRGNVLEVATGLELMGLLGKHTSIYNGFGVTHAKVAGADRTGGFYEVGGALILDLSHAEPDRPGQRAGSATLLEGALSVSVGGYGGLPGHGDRGLTNRALLLAGVAHYWGALYSVRLSGGMLAGFVATAPNTAEGFYAPVASVTVGLNWLWAAAFDHGRN